MPRPYGWDHRESFPPPQPGRLGFAGRGNIMVATLRVFPGFAQPARGSAMDQATLIAKLTEAVGADYIHTDPVALRAYNCDALTIYKGQPSAVVLPGSTEEVQKVVRLCREAGGPLI